MHDPDDDRDEGRSGNGQQRSGGASSAPREEFDAISAAEELEASMREAPGPGGGASADAYVEMLEGEIAALEEELGRARADAAAAEARADAATEEVERARARLAREAERALELRRREVIEAFLEVLDDLDRALDASRSGHVRDVVAGIELVRRRFLATLGRFGVAHLPSLGAPFDPAVHEAVAAVPVDDPSQAGRVVGVISEGYTIGDEVLRPARVAVGQR